MTKLYKSKQTDRPMQKRYSSGAQARKQKPLHRVAQPVPRRSAVPPMRGLLHPEPTPPKGMSLFDYEPPPSGRLKR